MKEIHAEPPLPRDYVRNSYCKRVITSTAESKRVFFCFVFCFFKSQNAHQRWRLTSNVVSALNWSGVCIYIYNSVNTLSGGKSCLVAPGVTVPPWATEIVLSPRVGGWWGQGNARAFTRCMMKKNYTYIYIYNIRKIKRKCFHETDKILPSNYCKTKLWRDTSMIYKNWKTCEIIECFPV